MKLNIVLLCIVVVSLFLTACSSGDNLVDRSPFRKGVAELQLELIDDLPPVYESKPVYLPYRLSNYASYDATNIQISAVYTRKFVEFFTGPFTIPQLQGITVIDPLPVEKDIVFEGQAGYLLPGKKDMDLDYFVLMKYSSHVLFEESVCVGTQSSLDVNDGGCDVDDTGFSYSGQGAPLAITSLQQISYGQYRPEMQFHLVLKNRGSGEIKRAAIVKADLGGEPISCSFPDSEQFDGAVLEPTKDEKSYKIICIKPLTVQTSYVTPLQLEITYDYEVKQKERIKILKIGSSR